jgi:hypothetical protein
VLIKDIMLLETIAKLIGFVTQFINTENLEVSLLQENLAED